MADAATTQGPLKTPWHVWVVGGLVALWNAFGAFDFTATATRFEPYMAQFPQELKDYWYAFPLWMWALWGVAVWGGFLGAVLVLLRNKLAIWALGAGLLCALASFAIGFFQPAPEGTNDPTFAGIIIAIAVAFLGYAVWLSRRGVLR